MKKPSFTLLETLISLGVLTVFIGGGLTMNRNIIMRSSLMEGQRQRIMLAKESIDTLSALIDAEREAGVGTDGILAAMGLSSSAISEGNVYGSQPAGSSVTNEKGGPIKLEWCNALAGEACRAKPDVWTDPGNPTGNGTTTWSNGQAKKVGDVVKSSIPPQGTCEYVGVLKDQNKLDVLPANGGNGTAFNPAEAYTIHTIVDDTTPFGYYPANVQSLNSSKAGLPYNMYCRAILLEKKAPADWPAGSGSVPIQVKVRVLDLPSMKDPKPFNALNNDVPMYEESTILTVSQKPS